MKDNDALLRTHGIKKDRVEKSTEAPIGNRIHLTPAASCGLTLKSESFGTLLSGVDDRPISPPSSPDTSWDAMMPSGFELDQNMGEPMSLKGLDTEPVQPAKAFPTKIPPRLQRLADSVMSDITLIHKADELANDPFLGKKIW